MSETLKLSVLNAENGLCDPQKAGAIAETACDQNPDLVFFAEGTAGNSDIHKSAIDVFTEQGLEVSRIFYNDMDRESRNDNHSAVLVYNPNRVKKVEVVHTFGRNSLLAVTNDDFAVLGIHGIDRFLGYAGHGPRVREEQAKKAVELLEEYSSAALMGGFNALHGKTAVAKMLRVVGPLTYLLEAGQPGTEQTKIERFASLAQRLTSFADGGMLSVLAEAGYVDADKERKRPTMHFDGIPIPGMQLDHILTRGLKVDDVNVNPVQGLSDHSFLHATVRR